MSAKKHRPLPALGNALQEALHAYQSGAYPLAETLCHTLLQKHPNHPEVLQLLGYLAVQTHRFEEAFTLMRRAITAQPRHAMFHFSLGWALHEGGRFTEAIQAYRQAIALQPNLAQLHYNLGNSLKALGYLEEAAAAFQETLRHQPNHAKAHYNLGNLMNAQGRPQDAAIHYKKAATLQPDMVEAHNNLGVLLQKAGQLREAEQCYRKSLALKPDYADGHLNLGIVYMELGLMDHALTCCQKSLALRPNDAETCFNIGNIYKKLKQFDQAAAFYRQTLHLNPDFEKANHFLAAITGENRPRAPRKYVTELFNNSAQEFETLLVTRLDYQIPKIMRAHLEQHPELPQFFATAVDMGCGTGLAGSEFRPMTGRLIGIDLADQMIQLAAKKKVYDHLLVGDLVEVLAGLNPGVDLFIAADVFVYIGDLRDVFQAVQSRAAENALLIFSVEHEEYHPYLLRATGRYAHAPHYIQQLAREFGFTIKLSQINNLRKEYNEYIVGCLYILQRG